VTVFADILVVVSVLIAYSLVLFFGTVALVWLVGWSIKRIGGKVARSWTCSVLRTRYRRMSKATLNLLNGVIGNLLVVLPCLPLLWMPLGSGVKPMTLPVLMLMIAVATAMSCHRTSEDASRPEGSKLLQFVGDCLCLLPLFVGVLALHLFAAMRNLTFG
jgi:hypothetical protein